MEVIRLNKYLYPLTYLTSLVLGKGYGLSYTSPVGGCPITSALFEEAFPPQCQQLGGYKCIGLILNSLCWSVYFYASIIVIVTMVLQYTLKSIILITCLGLLLLFRMFVISHSSFISIVIKYPDKNNLREKGLC